MFADDVMVFLKPKPHEISACSSILDMFGHASGLHVNLAKTATLPIRCTREEMQLVRDMLGCSTAKFPCKYLGLPLTIRKQTSVQFRGLVDQLAAMLPHWKAATLPKSRRLLLIQSVLTAIPIHSMLALGLPPKTLAAMTKICQSFLWSGKAEAGGGACEVAWDVVCNPKWAGGLSVLDLRWMNVALQTKWIWLQKTDTSRPWAEFAIPVPKESSLLERTCGAPMFGFRN